MANETYLTLVGTMHADPELRFTPSGGAVANFAVRVNARRFNRDTNKFDTAPGKFWNCQAWNQGGMKLAENVAEGLNKGDSVVVYGYLDIREYEDKSGAKKYAEEFKVEAIGKNLCWHSAAAPAPSSAGSVGAWTPPDPWGAPAAAPATGNAPNAWNQPAPAAQNTGWPSEPPF
ncbi:single-stranded DNA-binding protein [Paeniglutamicibacter sp. R2-26]|uniref:single-stranded DNA-binding protein n=1 Tax=Paeniglutamicibacter sp. R2-26 TaxID=3144417 RepID=UPI003EE4EF38